MMTLNAFKNKNILVTGATGLIGYNLVCHLLNEEISKLYATGRSLKKLESTFKEFSNNKELVLIAHDTATTLPTKLKDIDYIFHAAGPMEREIVLNRPVDVILPNIQGVINCLEFLKVQEKQDGKKGRLVVFSSVTVYDNPTLEDYVATEEITNYASSLDSPIACYSESKRMIEVIAKAYAKQYCVDAVMARFSTVYGYTKNIPNTAFYEFLNKARRGEDIVLNGIGLPRRDNIYVDDAIEGLLKVATHGESANSYNISSNGDKGNFVAVDEIAQIISKTFSKRGISSNVICKENTERKPGLMLSNLKLKELGWECKYSFEEGIEKTITLMSNSSI